MRQKSTNKCFFDQDWKEIDRKHFGNFFNEGYYKIFNKLKFTNMVIVIACMFTFALDCEIKIIINKHCDNREYHSL